MSEVKLERERERENPRKNFQTKNFFPGGLNRKLSDSQRTRRRERERWVEAEVVATSTNLLRSAEGLHGEVRHLPAHLRRLRGGGRHDGSEHRGHRRRHRHAMVGSRFSCGVACAPRSTDSLSYDVLRARLLCCQGGFWWPLSRGVWGFEGL